MPKHADVKKVLVIGSGPIIIGQAAEFDYAGTQACRTLKEEGMEVVLINSNPATIMTDKDIADKVYIEPLTVETLKKVIIAEKPDSILPTLGGQTGLNLAMEIAETGFLEEHNVKLLGTSPEVIHMAEDRQGFKDAMEDINQPCIASKVVETYADGLAFAYEIGFPVIIRPAYTLGGTGGGIANNEEEFSQIAPHGLRLSRVGQILVEKCIAGWKEIEFEAMRDSSGSAITICSMENLDPVGVHTGDSIVVAPAQTLATKEFNMLREAALKIINKLGVEGGCNIQFALEPNSFEYAVIEVNPRLSRSSALASKATGYPIAKVATRIALGYNLDEIKNAVTGKTYAGFEPTIDYIVAKFPKWPFDKFVTAERKLGTQMKATGEVMSIGTCFESALLKAVRSLELNIFSLDLPQYQSFSKEMLYEELKKIDDMRLFVVAQALLKGITVEEIHSITKIDNWFLTKIKSVVDLGVELKKGNLTPELLNKAKIYGYTDKVIGEYVGMDAKAVKEMRKANSIMPAYKMVDTCAAEFEAVTPYYYSCYGSENESTGETKADRKKIMVLGSGPIRIGQGIEFDYCSVHCVWALKSLGYETIIVNNNPETVSTDFDIADKLYFEPLTPEDVENIVDLEQPYGAIVQFGGQTAIKLTKALKEMGVKILGTKAEDVDRAEDRELFDEILEANNIPRPAGRTVFTCEEAIAAANEIGYPVLVRPSYVLGGQGMEIAYNDRDITVYMEIINRSVQEHPILVDKYVIGKEVEVDAVCDGKDILIPGIMEHVERTGVHSGDSISVYPTQTITKKDIDTIIDYTEKLARALNVVGLINIQFIVAPDGVYIIEVNPRSSRTVPYISKVTNVPIVKLAVRAMMGEKLCDMGYGTGLNPAADYVAVKMPVFSFEKLHDVDTSLGPEMKSTGEVLGIAPTFHEALYKSFVGSNMKIPTEGNLLITVRDTDKEEVCSLAKEFEKHGFRIYATGGTCQYLVDNGVSAKKVNKIAEGAPDILDFISGGGCDLVINTPTKGRVHNRDGFKIRRTSVERSIPCLTSLDTAKALLNSIEQKETGEVGIIDISTL
ncbi:MAG: carbamoyl-phosphate synthase large subunit [Clostridia bacterium]|nr:carbamoyl-phosphate synthase large subunit [Clostridia bacterium]